MKKWLPILSLLLFGALPAFANQAAQGFCTVGNVNALTQGLKSTNTLQGSYPQCQVSVFVHGTQTLATIYSDNGGTPTPLDNPFTAGADGTWFFYAALGHYDVTLSGGLNGGFTQPYTISDLLLQDCSSGQCTAGGGVVPASPYDVGIYTSNGADIQGSNIFSDSTGNNLHVPGATTSFEFGEQFYVDGAPSSCSGGSTPFDCAKLAADAAASTGSFPVVLKATRGLNLTNNGFHESALNRVSLEGQGQFTSTLQQATTNANATVFYDCFASSTADANAVHISNLNIDANNLAPQVLAMYGQNLSYIDHVAVKGATGANNFVQMGSTSCPAGQFGGTFQLPINDLYIDGKGTGPSSWATGTVSISGGTPSVAIGSGGTYNHQHPPGYLIGYGAGANPCTAMGTVSVATAASGSQFTVTGVTLSGFSGCSVGNGAYIFIPDLPPAAYGIDLQFWTDGAANMLVTNSVGQVAGIRNANSANVFTAAHPYNSYTGIEDDAGGKWFGIDADSNEYMMKLTAPTQVSGLDAFYNSTTQFKGAGLFLLGNGSNGSTFHGNSAVTASLNSDYHAFITTAGGPVDTGQGSWPSGDVDTGSPTIDPTGQNIRHEPAMNAVDDYVGFMAPATAGANFQSFNRFWCHSDWNGSAPEKNCWGIHSTPSTSGVPTQDALHITPPSGSLAPVSGEFVIIDPPANASSGGNVNSVTLGIRGSYYNGTVPVNVGWNLTVNVGSGANPLNTLIVSPTLCTGGCQIQTSASMILTGSSLFQGSKYEYTNNSFLGDILPPSLSAARTWTMPDATGTVALTSQVPAPAPVRSGSVTVSGSTTAAVTFAAVMNTTPDSCVLQPQSDSTSVGTFWATALATTGFTVNIKNSGTISFYYACFKTNTN